MTKKRKQISQESFKVGDLVGAKIKGYPLWPGYIEECKGNNKYKIRFFGSDDTCQSYVQIKHFDEFTDKEKSSGSKGFKEAYKLCQEQYESIKRKNAKPESSPERKKKKTLEESVRPSTPSGTSSPSSSPPRPALSTLSSSPKPEHVSPSSSPRQTSTPPSPPLSASPTPQAQSQPSKQTLVTTTVTTKTKTITKTKVISEISQDNNDSSINKPNKSNTLIIVAKGLKASSPKDKIHSKKTPVRKDAQGENCNVIADPVIQKLKSKVDKKIEEKEKLKKEKKSTKIKNKVSEKIVSINEILSGFCSISKRISSANEVSKKDRHEWNSALHKYNRIMDVLEKCAHFILEITSDSKNTTSEDINRCHDLLVNIVRHLTAAIKNEQVPADLRQETRNIKQSLKENKSIKEFINNFKPYEYKNKPDKKTKRLNNKTEETNKQRRSKAERM